MLYNTDKHIPYFLYAIFIYIASVGLLIPKGSFLTQIFGVLFFIIPVAYNLIFIKKGYFKFIYLYLFYLLFLVLILSDSYINSFRLLMKFSVSILLFPISFSIFNSEEKIKKLFRVLLIIAILYIINIIIANLLNLGGTKYSEEGIDVGNIFTEGLNSMAYIIVASPVILYFYPKRKILILTIITFVALLVLIQLKRISIIATIFGLLVFVFFYKEKSKVITGLATATLIFIAIFPLYSDIFEAQLEKRESKMQVQNLENEGRSMEFFWIISDLNESTSKFLFGHNMFNSSGNYNNPDSKERQIHNDYNALLHGSGIFGLIYFISLQFYLYYLYLKVKRKINNKLFHLKQENKLLDLFKYLFPAFFFMGFLIMMSGGMYAYLFNSIRYITLGSVLGYMYHENHKISKL